MLGIIYYGGLGVPQDYKQAADCLTKAAEQGYAAAQYKSWYNISRWVRDVPQDYKQAIDWLTKAADQGYAAAQL